jgi:uncharacterized membrane protein YjfL (UPF0719 family)
MDFSRVALSAFELLMTIGMAVLVVYVTMRALIRTNTDFDEDKEILRGNLSVGVLVAALLLASANIMHHSFSPVADTIHAHFAGPARAGSAWQIASYALGNLALGFVIVVGTLSLTLRLFGRLTRTERTRPGKELERGNVAMGVLLSAVVLIVSMFVAEGVQALSKALIPVPTTGRIQILR